MRRLLAYAAIYLLWGGSFLAIRHVVAVIPPFFIAGLRFLTAGALLYAYGGFQHYPRPSMRQCISAALLGLVMFAGNYACLFWSERFLPSGLAAVLTSLIPVWIFLAEWLFLHAVPVTAKTLLGILLGVGGVALLALPSGVSSNGHTKAALILVLGTFLWSVGTIACRWLDLPKQPTRSASLQMLLGGCFLLLLSVATDEFPRLHELSHRWHWELGVSLGYLVLASIAGFTSYVWLIGREPASRVASYAYVNPVVALLLGFMAANERPTPIEYVGAFLVLVGVFSTVAGQRRNKSAPLEPVI